MIKLFSITLMTIISSIAMVSVGDDSTLKDPVAEVKIGQQIWMAENLNTDKFNNGDAIPQVQTKDEWVLAGQKKQPAWCYYQNDSANGARYGRIYNWYAISDPRGLAPAGWRIPDNNHWMELSEYLGGERIAGKKMKSTTGWKDNGNGSYESGFNAEPSGGRYANGSFVFVGESVGFWSSNQDSLHTAWFRYLTAVDDLDHKYSLKKAAGMYVRCIKE